MIRGAVLYMAAMLATAWTDTVAGAAILLVVVGFASIIFLTTGNSTIQIAVAVAPAYRGRVTALWSTAFVGTAACGAAAITGLAILNRVDLKARLKHA